jgi:nitrite reductase/ring-hydroxylating ferredoxin subunit/uncharacterized membrane protein
MGMVLDPVRAVTDRLDAVIVSQSQPLESGGRSVQGWIAAAFRWGGSLGQGTKNLLNGVWLGHPLHPALTDVPIGAWTSSLIFDLVGLDRSADTTLTLGVVAAIPTALAGAADWVDAGDEPRKVGFLHGLLNVGALGLYLASMRARASGSRALGVGLSATGYGIAVLSAWLGGELVYRHGTGVNRNAWREPVQDFQPAADAASLQEGRLTAGKISVNGQDVPIVLLKRGSEVLALGGACSHWGGPLAEGKLVDGECVQCPWHGSQFDMRNGSVQRGPATVTAPVFETRIRDGRVEVRTRSVTA